MYQKNSYDLPFCGLSMRLYPTGKQSPKYEYSGEASKVKFTCSLTKKKYGLSQISEWVRTPEVAKYTKAGYVLKYMTKVQENNNPSQYAKSNLEQIFCLVMVKPYKPQTDNVDGLKPISQSMPPHATQFAPDSAVTAEQSDMDDEIPF